MKTLEQWRQSWSHSSGPTHPACVELFEIAESLQRWKREATEVEAEWDSQAVARLLGIEWGRSIRAGIEPEVRRMQEQNAALSRQLAERQWQSIESAPPTVPPGYLMFILKRDEDFNPIASVWDEDAGFDPEMLGYTDFILIKQP